MSESNFEQKLKEELNKNTGPLKKELNLEQKTLFSRWLINAINDKDKKSFKAAVKVIGKEWHVFRIKSNEFNNFVDRLWDKKDDIKTGKYRLWSINFSWINKNGNVIHAHSYESKICFLVYPQKYKLIYDDNNKAQLKKVKELKEITKGGISEENWQEVVDAYYKKCVKSNPSEPEDFFKIDCKLWAAGA